MLRTPVMCGQVTYAAVQLHILKCHCIREAKLKKMAIFVLLVHYPGIEPLCLWILILFPFSVCGSGALVYHMMQIKYSVKVFFTYGAKMKTVLALCTVLLKYLSFKKMS